VTGPSGPARAGRRAGGKAETGVYRPPLAPGADGSERRGTWVYYRVNPDVMARMSAVLAPGITGLARMPG
jgi:hypothetical protein